MRDSGKMQSGLTGVTTEGSSATYGIGVGTTFRLVFATTPCRETGFGCGTVIVGSDGILGSEEFTTACSCRMISEGVGVRQLP
jgi:phosphomannomutase